MRRRRLLAGLGLLAAATGLGYCTGPALVDRDVKALDAGTCQEDEACWDCRTMGNRLCGPITPYGSDGRYAVCGLVTADGVTEHLDAFVERCRDEG